MKNRKKFNAKTIRHELHKLAELSGKEIKTSNYIHEWLHHLNCTEIINDLGGGSLVAVYDTGQPGKSIMLRTELDALPIRELNEFSYISNTPGVSHKCGHDGHMAIMLSVADWLRENIKHIKGKVYLLFQSAEETAGGARSLIMDKRFLDLKPDYIFALHNLPGFPRHSLILRKGVFASASLGMKFHFIGKTSHAGHPENGINPLDAMQSLITGLSTLSQRVSGFGEHSLVTVIHLWLGEAAFGTSPGEGVVMATLRSADDHVLEKMAASAEELAEGLADIYNLESRVERVEAFAATKNDPEAYNVLLRSAEKSGLDIIHRDKIFSWTEDFSFYGSRFKTAFLGLGSGESHPQLHNADYDFADELIKSGKEIFIQLIKEVLE